jgi:hypothetical protein
MTTLAQDLTDGINAIGIKLESLIAIIESHAKNVVNLSHTVYGNGDEGLKIKPA